MNRSELTIRSGSIEEAVHVSQVIAELENPHGIEIYRERLKDKKHLIAIAEVGIELVGFKVGYDKFGNTSFYTWMGGVVAEYRNMGIARALATYQEKFAARNGFDSVILKTRNKHVKMLHFALNSGFNIIDVEPREDSSENRILLKKDLAN